MSATLTVLLASIILLFLFLPLFYFIRRRVELSLEGDILNMKYPFNTKRIDLDKELKNWDVQKAYYLRWGEFNAVGMLLTNGKRVAVSSLFNQNNYDLLYGHLNSRFNSRRKTEEKAI